MIRTALVRSRLARASRMSRGELSQRIETYTAAQVSLELTRRSTTSTPVELKRANTALAVATASLQASLDTLYQPMCAPDSLLRRVDELATAAKNVGMYNAIDRRKAKAWVEKTDSAIRELTFLIQLLCGSVADRSTMKEKVDGTAQ